LNLFFKLKMLKKKLLLTISFQFALAGLWSDLKVTWGINPLDPQYFQSVPITEQDAVKSGWTLEKDCSKINGRRYVKQKDRSVLLVFDASGAMAGIASAMPKNSPFNFPSSKIQSYFVDEGDAYILTAYFVDPQTVCSSTSKPAASYGDRVIIAGKSAQAVLPLDQKDAESSKFWTKGCIKYFLLFNLIIKSILRPLFLYNGCPLLE
jgi:hypothetical protein